MGRYSFFINIAINIYAPSQFLDNEHVYASSIDDADSNNSFDVQSVDLSDSDIIEQEAKQYESIDSEFKEDEIYEEEKDIFGKSELSLNNLMIQPFAYPSNNWGFNYQVSSSYSWADTRPIYNNFVDHVAGRINSLQAGINSNLQKINIINEINSTQSSQISNIQIKNTAQDATISSLNSGLYSAQNNIGLNRSNISGLSDRFNDLSSSLKKDIYDIQMKNGVQSSDISGLSTRVTALSNQINSIGSYDDFNLRNTINLRSSEQLSMLIILRESLDDFKKIYSSSQITLLSGINSLKDTINSRSSEQLSMLTIIRQSFDDFKKSYTTNQSILTSNFTLLIQTINNRHSELKEALGNRFSDYFSSSTPGSDIASNDGIFSKLIKGQTNRIIDTVQKNSYDDTNLLEELVTVITAINNRTWEIQNKIDNRHTELKETINNRNKELIAAVKDVGDKIKNYTLVLDAIGLSSVNNGTKIADFSKKNDENLTLLLAAVIDNKYEDDLLRESLYNRFQQFLGVTAGAEESGISGSDGVFTKVIKGQFTRLISELNRIFTLQIGKFDQIKVAVTQLDQNVAEQFGLLYDWFKLEMEWLEVLSENLLTIAKNISTSNGWLKSIYEKPVGGGSVVNPPPEGTNFWDVLKALVDGLAEIAKSIVGLVDDLLDKLIHLIIPENPDFFADDISKLTDSFDLKFSWAIDLSDSFKGIYSQPKSLKSLNISVAGKQYKVIPDFVDLNLIKTILTGYFCFLTLFTSYKRIVGGGDVIQ